MDLDAISLDNIDVLPQWRVEFEVPILEESPTWLEEPLVHEQQEEEERHLSATAEAMAARRMADAEAAVALPVHQATATAKLASVAVPAAPILAPRAVLSPLAMVVVPGAS